MPVTDATQFNIKVDILSKGIQDLNNEHLPRIRKMNPTKVQSMCKNIRNFRKRYLWAK